MIVINKGGAPELTHEEKMDYLHKLEPYLKQGLSVYRSCIVAGVPKSSVFDLIKEEQWFADKIELFKSYRSKLLNNIFISELEEITENLNKVQFLKQKLNDPTLDTLKKNTILSEIRALRVNKDELSFLQWLVLNDREFRDQFASRQEITGNEGVPLVATVLDNLEKTNYEQFADNARKQLTGSTLEGQILANEQPLQNQE